MHVDGSQYFYSALNTRLPASLKRKNSFQLSTFSRDFLLEDLITRIGTVSFFGDGGPF